ncbi:5972_t:CDS:2 [Paraglomus occultum]|uniref:5972_t:CDS:1 n=1 Tax=Paraglomus occultum TaxID=144539 RepID=A0A9N9FBR9_9GLOM|nr:5972_t:CDS:2 [Paraglomus occultum]
MANAPPPVFGAPAYIQQPGITSAPPTQLAPPIPKQLPCTTPSNTLYLNNLNEKIKIPALKSALRSMFEQYGEILDVVAHSNLRMRGQAFVVFKDQESAVKAHMAKQGVTLENKPVVIQYARSKSDAIAKLDGTYEEHKKQRMEAKEKRAKEPPQKKMKHSHPQGYPTMSSGIGGAGGLYFGGQVPGATSDEFLPPNKILFIQNLPADVTEQSLTALFQQYPGFKEVRMIPTKKDIAFVEYDTEPQAMAAKETLADHQISPDHKIKITYARK